MTKQDFIEYLSHPEKLNGHSIAALEKLVQEYPYFQIGRMLYLKNLHNEDNIDYEKNMHITSAYAPNGKVLYNLIKKKAVQKNTPKEPLVKLDENKIQNSKPDEVLEIINPLPFAAGEAITEEEIIPKLQPVTVLEEAEITSKDKLPEIKKEKQDTLDEMQMLEKQMLREAYRTSMTVNLLEETDIKSSIQITNEETSSIVPALPVRKDSFGAGSYRPLSISESYSFGDWMKLVREKALPLTTPKHTSLEVTVTRKSKNEILDNFLLEESVRSAPKPKAAFYSAEGMAKKSLQDDENFVSETLARIYLKQGNLTKAKRAYEILLVKHPEKVHIFAPLLEKIKELIKQQSPSRSSRKEGEDK